MAKKSGSRTGNTRGTSNGMQGKSGMSPRPPSGSVPGNSRIVKAPPKGNQQ